MSSSTPGLCDADRSLLLVIDIQERLARAIPAEDLNPATRSTEVLLQAASLLGIPALSTEQYPRGLGPTLAQVRQHLGEPGLEKTGFSCCAANGFAERLAALQRRQVILAGMETHVCVLQTAFELKQQGYTVIVAEDACCARSPQRNRNGLARMQRADISVAHSESIIFEWLRDATHPQFKAISTLVK